MKSFTTPQGLMLRGTLLIILCLLAWLCGLRDYAAVLSFTTPDGSALTHSVAALGFLWLFLWFCATTIAPVLMIAAGLLAAWNSFAKSDCGLRKPDCE